MVCEEDCGFESIFKKEAIVLSDWFGTFYNHPKGNADTKRMMSPTKEEVIWLNKFSSFEKAREKIERWIEFDYTKLHGHSEFLYMSPEEYKTTCILGKS